MSAISHRKPLPNPRSCCFCQGVPGRLLSVPLVATHQIPPWRREELVPHGHCVGEDSGEILESRRSTTVGPVERPLTVNQDSLSELSRSVSRTAETLFAAGNVTDTLSSVVGLAVATI